MDKEKVIAKLQEKQLISGSSPEFLPLKGGVSSDIFLVVDGEQKYVIKQALQKLRVQDDWFADISRNDNEQDFLRFLERYRPESVPNLVYSDPEDHFFVMEYLDEGFKNWKHQMLQGVFEERIAQKSAELLADIHLQSLESDTLKQQFNNAENFYSLRTEPYLVTTGKRHPKLKSLFDEEVKRLNDHREALVHGDFSPKNLMVKEDRVVLLDHEVASFGDPAFDVAFFLNHLYLKMHYHFKRTGELRDLTKFAWNTYFDKVKGTQLEQMETRMTRLLLMLMLARIDGKSPVEYFREVEKEFVRVFVNRHLPEQVFRQSEIRKLWKKQLKEISGED